ncbi:hypothetical protein [Plantactinospora endophytica]|uniref:DUF3618 domain-containing protein n=1 Tax=Plantactinospora endophytica TaxID=673535 RepID=A0ABQ4DU96_9ACTN|nr:hypothetical protein [Plantactinospora endophytica]GIG86031.1 hypothetical protein Pen02_09670 [Plantactinospora endophytica]
MTRGANAESSGDGHRSTTQVARQGATETGQRASQMGGGLAHSAADRGRDVAGEAGRQAQQLMGQASTELKQQAGAQQHRAASGLRALGEELRAMSERTDRPGMATDLVRHAADRAQQAAQWLDQREPGMVVADVRDYARRNPGLFLAGAAIAGVLAGRLTRSRDVLRGDDQQSSMGHPDGMRGRPGSAPSGPSGSTTDGQAYGVPR